MWDTAQEKWKGEAGTFLLKYARAALTATAMPGRSVWLIGGFGKKDQSPQAIGPIEIVFEYQNEVGETVVDIGPGQDFPIPMLHPRWDHRAVRLDMNTILVVGGLQGNPKAPTVNTMAELYQ